MEKLVKTRNAHLVQVKGELVAAGKLAGRQAPVGEAKQQLILLQELAGNFRRTQTAIEGEQESMEAIEAEGEYREQFNEVYYNAWDIIERYIAANTPAKSRVLASGSATADKSDGLREAMRLLQNTQRVMVEELIVRSGGKIGVAPNSEAFSDEQLLRNDEPEPDLANRKIWISSKDLNDEGNGALKGQPEAETTSDIVAEVPVEAPQVAMASLPTSVSELDRNGSQAEQNLNDLGKEPFSRTIWEQKEVPKLLQLTPSGRTATALKHNMDEHFIVRLPVDDSKKLQDWKLIQLDSNIVVECHDNTTTESPTATLKVEPISEKDDKDKLGLPDVVEELNVGAGVDGFWIGTQRSQQAVRKEQVEGSWKASCFCPPWWKTSNPVPDVFRIPWKRMDRWQLMHSVAELWTYSRVEHLFILQPRAVGAGEEGVPELDERHPDEKAVMCGGWCSTSTRSWRYNQIEAAVPQGGGVCFGGQPYSPYC